MDAIFIRGMLRNPDIQPNATINRWIAAILLFDFKLVHVPANKHCGPDGLSRREPIVGEDEDEDDPDDWVDRALSLGTWVLSWVDRSSISGSDRSNSPPPLRHSSRLQQRAQALADKPSTPTSVNLSGDTPSQSTDEASELDNTSHSGNVDPDTLLDERCGDVLPYSDLAEKADGEIATIHHYLEARWAPNHLDATAAAWLHSKA